MVEDPLDMVLRRCNKEREWTGSRNDLEHGLAKNERPSNKTGEMEETCHGGRYCCPQLFRPHLPALPCSVGRLGSGA